ncbi:mitotic-spindle organizing protein 2-like isoform X1 [Nannospalax galili]|nr:mitotic-spindle organizing protein 2-like isoform X1 [Nannospalax galili]
MADGGGAGLGASTGLEAATLQKLALRRKKVVGAEDMELYELAQAAGATVDPDVFKILVDLLNLNVAPLAVFQMLKSMCAGQRLASEPQDCVSMSLPTSETRGRNRDGPTLSSASTLAERGSREGSMQRIPRQPSATRLPKVGGPGKSTSRGSS